MKNLLVLDGGLATELERKGCVLQDHLWSARILNDQPELIREVHRDYLHAGADVITSASYQASLPGFMNHGFSSKHSEQLIRNSVSLARLECDAFENNRPSHRQRPRVAASIGPYGAFLADGSEYVGAYDVTDDELWQFHHRRWQWLIQEKPDLVLCETIPSIAEVRVLIDISNEFPEVETWISLSCSDSGQMCDGTSLSLAAETIEQSDSVSALGVNCISPQLGLALVKQIHFEVNEKQILIYSNSGETWNAMDREWEGRSEMKEFATHAAKWIDSGANIIGGCCRTTPDHIRVLREMVDQRIQ